jgi:hypothetical protein
MPAIQLDRLKKQVIVLSQCYDRPSTFIFQLRDLLSYYANRTYRSGHTGKAWPMMQEYRVPLPVLHQIVSAVFQQANKNYLAILSLCDNLWLEPHLECRLLAALFLGRLPSENIEAILERIKSWGLTTKDEALLDALYSEGLKSIRKENPDLVLELAKSLSASPEIISQKSGIRLLFPLLEEPGFENIPVVFRILTPLFLKAPIELIPDLLDAIQRLARLSPTEMAYFLRQLLSSTIGLKTSMLIRQSLSAFPPDLQKSLRAASSGITEGASTIKAQKPELRQ